LIQDVNQEDSDPHTEKLHGLSEQSNQQRDGSDEQEYRKDKADYPTPSNVFSGVVHVSINIEEQKQTRQKERIERHHETASLQGAKDARLQKTHLAGVDCSQVRKMENSRDSRFDSDIKLSTIKRNEKK